MITTSFKNYDEFKELFVATNNKGEARRKNGILLSFIKSKEVRKYLRENQPSVQLSEFSNMANLFSYCKEFVRYESTRFALDHAPHYCIDILDDRYFSDKYAMDGHDGICVDGDCAAYRYQNMEREGRVFKMKVGKMYKHIIDLTGLKDIFPESVKLWLCEEVTRQWEAYAASKIPNDLFLHVDDDFCSIYGSGGRTRDCEGYFHSCMQGEYHENWKFYRDSVKAKAAYLTRGNEDDSPIVARCIIFTEVTRKDTGEVIRVAERQYSTEGDETLQRLLIQKLKDGGYIDAYKKTGAGCGDASAFVDIKGNDLSDVVLSIECNLESGDHLSYQDSFKWYYECRNEATNHREGSDYYESLDSTDDYYDYEDLNYDSWHERDTRNDTVIVYYNGREYDCDEDELDDFRYLEYGAHRDEYWHVDNITYCEDIDDYVHEDEALYSELLDCSYYEEGEMLDAEREYKKDHGWTYAEYDDDYYEDEDDVTSYIAAVLADGTFERRTISEWSLRRLEKNGLVVIDENTGIAYDSDVLEELAA